MPDWDMGKEAEIRSDPRGWRDVCVGGSFALSSGARRVSPPDSERGEGRGFTVFLIKFYHFLSRGARLMNRPKQFLNQDLRGAAAPDSRGETLRRQRVGDFGPKRPPHGRGFSVEFRPWIAIWTEPVRSRSPCGVRTARRIYKTKCSVMEAESGSGRLRAARSNFSNTIKVSKYRGLEARSTGVDEKLNQKDADTANSAGSNSTPAPSASPFGERV